MRRHGGTDLARRARWHEPKIDAEAMVRDAKRYGATAFCVSGSGIVALYRTRMPHHPLSRALGDRDLLAEIIPVTHREGLRVLARIDSNAIRRRTFHSRKYQLGARRSPTLKCLSRERRR